MIQNHNRVALLLSGGPDSTTLLYDLLNQGKEIYAVTFNFGETEGCNESQHAQRIVTNLHSERLHHYQYDFSEQFKRFYELPQPQFLRKAFGPFVVAPNKEEHVQPFGSAIALMLMASWALKHDIVDVYYAVHSNDAVFHDNHASYFEALHTVTVECEGDEYGVTFHTPYLSINKCAVIQKGMGLGVPFGDTWSCALGETVHCGVCDPCRDRRTSFEILGIKDPVLYEHDIFAESREEVNILESPKHISVVA